MNKVLPFGPRDNAVDCQGIVDTLKRMLDGRASLVGFAANLKLAMRERVWERERLFAGGTRHGPVTFHSFIYESYPVGLGATYEVIEDLIGSDIEALALWTEVTKRKPGNDNPRDEKGRLTPSLDNVQERQPEAPTGNTAAAGLRKLQKAASEGNEKAKEEFAEAVASRKTVHRACVDAGLRKNTRIDRDVQQRAARELAEWIVEHANGNDLDAVKANLFAAGAKVIAAELMNLTGPSIMDRRYGGAN